MARDFAPQGHYDCEDPQRSPVCLGTAYNEDIWKSSTVLIHCATPGTVLVLGFFSERPIERSILVAEVLWDP